MISQSDVKEECTLPQSIKEVKGEVSLMRYQLINLVRQIIKRNNVHGNEKQTREKCRKVVENSFRSASSTSSMFKFKGVKLGTLYPVAYKDIIVDTIYEFIMTEGQKNYEKFDTDMCVIFDEFCSKILESVNAL